MTEPDACKRGGTRVHGQPFVQRLDILGNLRTEYAALVQHGERVRAVTVAAATRNGVEGEGERTSGRPRGADAGATWGAGHSGRVDGSTGVSSGP